MPQSEDKFHQVQQHLVSAADAVQMRHTMTNSGFSTLQVPIQMKTPAAAEKREALKAKIQEFTQGVNKEFPYLVDEVPVYGTVPLGSTYIPVNKHDPNYHKFCNYELDLRVGLGHELLQEVRVAAAESFGLHKRQESSRGVTDMQKVGRAQKSAATRRGKVVSAYTRNWKRVEALLGGPWIRPEERLMQLKGLQKLNPETDVRYYQEPGMQTGTFVIQAAKDVSWIWQVAMLGSVPGDGEAGMRSTLASWEDECRPFRHCLGHVI